MKALGKERSSGAARPLAAERPSTDNRDAAAPRPLPNSRRLKPGIFAPLPDSRSQHLTPARMIALTISPDKACRRGRPLPLGAVNATTLLRCHHCDMSNIAYPGTVAMKREPNVHD